MTQGALTVESIDPTEHLAFLEAQPSASFLQTPAWGAVKSEWRSESIGWRSRSPVAGCVSTSDGRSARW